MTAVAMAQKASPFTLEKLDARDGKGETDLGWGIATIDGVFNRLAGNIIVGQTVLARLTCKQCRAEALLQSERGVFVGQFQHVADCPVLREVTGVTGEVTR